VRKLLLISSLLLACASAAAAQDIAKLMVDKKPNLSGVWIPQVEKERNPDAGPSGWTNMIVEQRDPELKFTLIHPNPDGKTTRKLEFTYYTDGRGEINDGMVYYFLIQNTKMAYKSVKSTTKWEGKNLVVVHKMATKMVAGQWPVTVNSDVIMSWELSSDGKTLTRTTKQENFSATYTDKSGEEKPLNVSLSGHAGEEYKDTYALLETGR
jgi:hypothetical protein